MSNLTVPITPCFLHHIFFNTTSLKPNLTSILFCLCVQKKKKEGWREWGEEKEITEVRIPNVWTFRQVVQINAKQHLRTVKLKRILCDSAQLSLNLIYFSIFYLSKKYWCEQNGYVLN